MKNQQEIQVPQHSKDTDFFNSEVEVKDSNGDVEPQGGYDGDEDQLARLGKKQVLKVCDFICDCCSCHADNHSVTLGSGPCWALAVLS